MFRAALSTKTLAIIFALFGLQFVCFCCGVPIRGYNMAEQAGAVDPRAIASPLMRPPEERYTGITWSITCPPPGVEHRELAGYLVCSTPLAGLVGSGGQIGLLPMLLLGIAALVAGYFLLWRLPLLLLRGGWYKLRQFFARRKADKILDNKYRGQLLDDAIISARKGGRHSKFLEQILSYSEQSILKAIKSLEYHINIHTDKINNPGKYISNWDKLSLREREGQLNYWYKEIDRFQHQADIARSVLRERNILP